MFYRLGNRPNPPQIGDSAPAATSNSDQAIVELATAESTSASAISDISTSEVRDKRLLDKGSSRRKASHPDSPMKKIREDSSRKRKKHEKSALCQCLLDSFINELHTSFSILILCSCQEGKKNAARKNGVAKGHPLPTATAIPLRKALTVISRAAQMTFVVAAVAVPFQ